MKLFSQLFTNLDWLRGFLPSKVNVNYLERARACLGALTGILTTALLCHHLLSSQASLPFIIAPMGASAVLLFAQPSSPLAQPWSLLAGNMLSALVGVTCAVYLGSTPFAAALAVAAAIAAMFTCRCLHPPGGAIALSAVLGDSAIHELGFRYVWLPVGLNSILLLALAIIFNNLTRHRYPHQQQHDNKNVHKTADITPIARLGFSAEDVNQVIQKYDEVLDISPDDLANLFAQTEMHTYRRRFETISCADIMSRDMVSVNYETPLDQAWQLLRKHKIKSLPVINQDKQIVGIVSLVDFMKHASLDHYQGLDNKLKRFVEQLFQNQTGKKRIVGEIMTTKVYTAQDNAHIVDLVPVLSDGGMHHIPIVDQIGHLVGIVTQSDLIAALYRARLNDVQMLDIDAK
ncbi:HPP family protein [Undibacterium danionis]|uniref:HPP family protein n=1 Tax=Undibacterium danionis TaxID=1812100 RepID=A0ABV6IJZ2_9BURK